MEVGQLLSDARTLRTRAGRPAAVLLAGALLLGCADGEPEEGAGPDPTPPSSIDAPAEVEEVPPGLPELCGSVSDERIEDLTGVAVVGIDGQGQTCTWSLTESAAVLGGPNEGGDASLEATFIDPDELASAEATDDPDAEVVPVEEVGDEAFLVRRDGTDPTTLYVRDGDRALALALANVLDGGNATEQALTDLAAEILASTS